MRLLGFTQRNDLRKASFKYKMERIGRLHALLWEGTQRPITIEQCNALT